MRRLPGRLLRSLVAAGTVKRGLGVGFKGPFRLFRGSERLCERFCARLRRGRRPSPDADVYDGLAVDVVLDGAAGWQWRAAGITAPTWGCGVQGGTRQSRSRAATATADTLSFCVLVEYASADAEIPTIHVPLIQNETLLAYRNTYGENLNDLEIVGVTYRSYGWVGIGYLDDTNDRMVYEFFTGYTFPHHSDWFDFE